MGRLSAFFRSGAKQEQPAGEPVSRQKRELIELANSVMRGDSDVNGLIRKVLYDPQCALASAEDESISAIRDEKGNPVAIFAARYLVASEELQKHPRTLELINDAGVSVKDVVKRYMRDAKAIEEAKRKAQERWETQRRQEEKERREKPRADSKNSNDNSWVNNEPRAQAPMTNRLPMETNNSW